jgi:single-strand DNA-binding protein
MNHLNSILVEGNLTHDPEYRKLPSGDSVCDFTIATDRFYAKGQETSFFNCEAWPSVARVLQEKGLHKGDLVRITGRIKQERWTDREGVKQAKVKICADHVGIL